MGISQNSFRFNIGAFECLIVRDGVLTVPDVKPKCLPGRKYLDSGHRMDVTCLLVKAGKRTILVDTGLGVRGQPDAGKLVLNLSAEGISCQDIDLVFLSHGHGDHCGGTTDAGGRPLWPKARYLISRAEWEFWTSDPEFNQVSIEERPMFKRDVQKHLMPIKDRVQPVEPDTNILPGIKFRLTPGHTPGHAVLVVSAGKENLFCIGDLFHQVSQLAQPGLYDIFDFEPERARMMRRQMLSETISTDTLVFAPHLPFPGLGHIIPQQDAWSWEPIERQV